MNFKTIVPQLRTAFQNNPVVPRIDWILEGRVRQQHRQNPPHLQQNAHFLQIQQLLRRTDVPHLRPGPELQEYYRADSLEFGLFWAEGGEEDGQTALLDAQVCVFHCGGEGVEVFELDVVEVEFLWWGNLI